MVRHRPFCVRRGESFRTYCYFEAGDKDVFGYGSEDEMCIVVLFYYPRQEIPFGSCGAWIQNAPCRARYNNRLIEDDDDFGRVFGPSKKVDNRFLHQTPAYAAAEANTTYSATARPSAATTLPYPSYGLGGSINSIALSILSQEVELDDESSLCSAISSLVQFLA